MAVQYRKLWYDAAQAHALLDWADEYMQQKGGETMNTDEKLQKAVKKLEDVKVSLRLEINRLEGFEFTTHHLTELQTQVNETLEAIQ